MLDWIEMVGFAGTGLTLAAWGMRRAVHLRVAGLASSVAFLSYGVLSGSLPVIATELALLPLNGWRLWQQLRGGSGGADWFLAHGTRSRLEPGEAAVREGDPATMLVIPLSGAIAGARLGEPCGSALPFAGPRPEARTCRAVTRAEVLRIDLAALEALAVEEPALMRRLAGLAAAQIAREARGEGRAEGGRAEGRAEGWGEALRPLPAGECGAMLRAG